VPCQRKILAHRNGSGDIIGGTDPASRNIVSGCGLPSAQLPGGGGQGMFLQGDTGALVEGNYIGTDHTGTKPLGNWTGVLSYGTNNVIGGTTCGAGNLISANVSSAIYIYTGPGTVIEGNLIGTDATGLTGLGNGLTNTSGSHRVGIEAYSAATINANVISANWTGIFTSSSPGSVVQGNLIGTDKTGCTALGNILYGIQDADTSQIGGTTAAARNVISGNGQAGIRVDADGSVIQGNDIGTDITGETTTGSDGRALGNGGSNPLSAANADGGGIADQFGYAATLGGPAPGAGNVISGNGAAGINLFAGNGCLVQGNLIGTDCTGTKPRGNFDGIRSANSASNNSILGNVIAANLRDGVSIGSLILPIGTGNTVGGNLIGTNAAGATNLGNRHFGVFVNGYMSDTLVGGTTAAAANIIADNGAFGVFELSSIPTVVGPRRAR
jgi:hypothetical protein